MRVGEAELCEVGQPGEGGYLLEAPDAVVGEVDGGEGHVGEQRVANLLEVVPREVELLDVRRGIRTVRGFNQSMGGPGVSMGRRPGN